MIELKPLANKAKVHRTVTARWRGRKQRVLCFRQSDFSVSSE